MDLENQKRVKEFADNFGPENVVVLLGAAEGEASGLAAETVTNGDPTYAGYQWTPDLSVFDDYPEFRLRGMAHGQPGRGAGRFSVRSVQNEQFRHAVRLKQAERYLQGRSGKEERAGDLRLRTGLGEGVRA